MTKQKLKHLFTSDVNQTKTKLTAWRLITSRSKQSVNFKKALHSRYVKIKYFAKKSFNQLGSLQQWTSHFYHKIIMSYKLLISCALDLHLNGLSNASWRLPPRKRGKDLVISQHKRQLNVNKLRSGSSPAPRMHKNQHRDLTHSEGPITREEFRNRISSTIGATSFWR